MTIKFKCFGFWLSLVVLIRVNSIQAAEITKVITFDDLPDGSGPVGGYEGFIWYNLKVLNGQNQPAGSGYRARVISSNNIAAGVYGEPVTLAHLTPFDLNSAYLTAVIDSTMNIEVKGFLGKALLYDNSFLINDSSPTFVNFNYTGIDTVIFIPSTTNSFAMDNVSVTYTPLSNAVTTQVIQPSSVGHFYEDAGPPDDFLWAYVQDWLVNAPDMTNVGGGSLQPFVADFDTNNQFSVTVAAPPGMKFLVKPPAGMLEDARMEANLAWNYDIHNSAGIPGAFSVNYQGLEGTPPDLSGSTASLGAYNGSFGFYIASAPFTNSFAFTSVTFTGTVQPSYTNSGVLNYQPLTVAGMEVFYLTDQQTDPGSFVFIVPIQPEISITPPQNGQFTVNFSGALQWATQPNGPFSYVPGNPQGTYTITNLASSPQIFFRTAAY